MLYDYKEIQPVAYKILDNAIKTDKISHAYIFESENYSDIEDFLISFVAQIVCKDINSKTHDEKKCFVCSSLKNKSYPELKIIKTDTTQIKKEEMTNLQIDFKSKPIHGLRMVYIIMEAEKLNMSASNSILKFLEEPEVGITAILIVKNRYQLMETILSRCQLIPFKKNKNEEVEEYEKIIKSLGRTISKEETEKFIEKVGRAISYIEYVDSEKEKGIVFVNKYYNQYFKERMDIIDSFKIMKLFFLECMNYKIFNESTFLNSYQKQLIKVTNNNTINSLAYKTEILEECINRLITNANTNLVTDYLCINYGGNT